MEYEFGELEDIARWIRENAAGEMAIQDPAQADISAVSEDKISTQAADSFYRIPWIGRSAQ